MEICRDIQGQMGKILEMYWYVGEKHKDILRILQGFKGFMVYGSC